VDHGPLALGPPRPVEFVEFGCDIVGVDLFLGRVVFIGFGV
jgi:hypothetical protein